MVDATLNEYEPDTVSPPGDTLLETIQALGMSQAELAQRTGRPRKTINEIIKAKAAITPETALQLERALRIPAGFWMSREWRYQEHLARAAERVRLSRSVDWLKKFPVKAMVQRGWILGFPDKVRQLQEVLSFFGVASPDQWEQRWQAKHMAFRKPRTHESDPGALAAWLRQGEILAAGVDCAPFARKRFKSALCSTRGLTRLPPAEFQPALQSLCAESGVAVVFVPELPKTRANGATCWLSPGKALIQLSLRYRWEDVFWFSFFHEAAHILRHGKRLVFVDSDESEGPEEDAANRFAADMLIPRESFEDFVGSGRYRTRGSVRSFAESVGVSAGIVVGRLHHEGLLEYSQLADLKRRFTWAEEE
ncbi:MAG: HigA family addiction module antidote protein [Candidatus Brocadiae bacterium]|nr:HigA family addiction module antidote protein [Candidatus Brocadiia bacterium]